MALAKFETKKQITMEKVIDRNLQWDNSHAKSIQLYKLIGEMITLDDLPFSHVEDIGFIMFVHKLAPLYNLKTRKYYSEKIMPDIYESVSNKVCDFLSDYIKLSFTTDIWTNDSAKVCLMSLTAHCIDVNFKRKKFVLCATELDERHTGEFINEMFIGMLERWSIPFGKVHVVLPDAGAT
ncbi:Zinc finger BED domain-containing protein 4-like [Oopsacas minuta]|uniref:Zinc finger BED domain-containing protein 4-like n=1 Tax=Oopsacas minuta TaxID=111878 RepID=A0AAV7JY55_9METZ|nr:Zinc finger BED domain-containing protein 4-like [Oopsacas minuta]